VSDVQTDRRSGRIPRPTPKLLVAVGGIGVLGAALVLFRHPEWLLVIVRLLISSALAVLAFYQALMGVIAYRSRRNGPHTERLLWINFAVVCTALTLLAVAVWLV
jgi:hypothetical protein